MQSVAGTVRHLKAPLYVRLAERFIQQMSRGALRPGDRVPSLRQLSQQQRVSVTTALQAYLWLENRGYLQSRPQSGFYVRTPYAKLIPEPRFEADDNLRGRPTAMGVNAVLASVMESSNDPANVPLGASCASPELLPNRKLNSILRHIVRQQPFHSAFYQLPPGVDSLRRQIARRALETGCELVPHDILVTSGGLEGINLSLRAVARRGDVVAVESPTYFGILQSIASLGMKVVELPTHPQQGMDLNRLERAVRKHGVKACVVMTNCHNPLGYVLPDSYKKSLVALAARNSIAIVEDDIYGDLTFSGPRPLTLKSFDRDGLVLLCSSFSKILAPGYRLGWLAAGRFQREVERLKFLTTMASASLPQFVVAEFLISGSYDRHLRKLRARLATQVDEVRQAVAKYFPNGTRISRPAGGYLLWVELPEKVNSLKLYRDALEEHISILPGPIFSSTDRYKNY